MELIKLARDIAKNTFIHSDYDFPVSKKCDEILVNGVKKRRLRIVLAMKSCKSGFCAMCPLPMEGARNEVGEESLRNQVLSSILESLNAGPINVLTIFHNGNFFSDEEVKPEFRDYLAKICAKYEIERLIVESLPVFISKPKLERIKANNKNLKLEVALGLQSASEFIRREAIASPCKVKDFKRAYELLISMGYSAQVFVMHQLPFLTVSESNYELKKSCEWINKNMGQASIVVSPLRIASQTVTALAYENGMQEMAGLWDLALVLEKIANEGGRSIRVAISQLAPNPGESNGLHAKSCARCEPRLYEWLNYFNSSKMPPLDFSCECYQLENFKQIKWVRKNVIRSIEKFLENRKKYSSRS